MIIGMDLMTSIGILVDTQDKVVRWEGHETPLKARGSLLDPIACHMMVTAGATTALQDAEERQTRILEADYKAINIHEHVSTLTNLSREMQARLKKVLLKHPDLFQGGLGTLRIKPIKLELKEGSQPYHARPFPVPQAYMELTKAEIDRLESIGVFQKDHDSEWAAPTFIQPKKTGDIRILTDFRRLNDQIKRKPHPLPKIGDILQKLSGFTYATALDLSMGYYHIPLDEESSKLCTTILPWGKYRYLRLPMGIKNP